MKRLGIDLGTSSLGWAILDDDKLNNFTKTGTNAPSPIDCGVIVFPEGMERDKSDNLTSPAAERRLKRAARRLIFRRKLRKFQLLRALIDLKMCPIQEESLQRWQSEGIYPITDKPFMAWLSATHHHNPYIDRKQAAEGPIDPLALGRALYHIAQRRGFKSSRKEQLASLQAQDEENGKARKKKDDETTQTKHAIDELTQKLKGRTLGQYFYDCYERGDKIRKQKTGRVEHYEKEFDVIAEKQQLPLEVAARLKTILFFQRPLKIQRHLVGKCLIEHAISYQMRDKETGKYQTKQRVRYPRCLISHPLFERFRALCFLNNLRVSEDAPREGVKLGKGDQTRMLETREREAILEALTRKSDAIIKQILPKELFSNYRPTDDAPVMPVTWAFTTLGLPSEQWQKAFNALIDFDDLEKLRLWSIKHFNFDEKQAHRFIRIEVKTERAQYSLHAIRKILPYLEIGMKLRKATFCAKLEDVIPNFSTVKDALLADLTDCETRYHTARKQASVTNRQEVSPLEMGYYKDCLLEKYDVSEDAFKQLYIDISETNCVEPVLPPVNLEAIRNPLACRALTVLRRLINTLRQEGKIDADTRINIELAHTVNAANTCRAIEKYQLERRAERNEAHNELQKMIANAGLSIAINDDLILRYLLWKEQNGHCVYTDKVISQNALLSNCDIEHTIPRSRGGTSKMENLTLCDPHYNREIKKNLLPSECPNATVDTEYPSLEKSQVLRAWRERLAELDKQLIRKPRRGGDPSIFAAQRQKYLITKMKRNYLAAKLKTFSMTSAEVDNEKFMPRQMVDTGIITKYAVRYLKTRYPHVYTTNGAATAFARKAWGLQKTDEAKERIDHTHHAVDAMVVAALDEGRFQDICKALGREHFVDYHAVCPTPYNNFGEFVRNAQETILIRHLPLNRQTHPFTFVNKGGSKKIAGIRGNLHNDTLYGRIRVAGETVTVLRKTIYGLSGADFCKVIENAVDKAVKETLQAQVATYRQQGISENDLSKQSYWMRKGVPGKVDIPILKVRIKVSNPKNPDVIRAQCFDSSENVYGSGGDLLELRLHKDAKGKLKPEAISLLDVAKQIQEGAQKQDAPAFLTLRPNMLALIYEHSPDELRALSPIDLQKRLYIIRKFEDTGRLTLWLHREARKSTVLSSDLKHCGKNAAGASKLDFTTPERLLLVSPSTYVPHMLFEGIHFFLTLDGRIEWLDHD